MTDNSWMLQCDVCLGLSSSQLEDIAHPEKSIIKTSRRDLPYILSQVKHLVELIFCLGGGKLFRLKHAVCYSLGDILYKKYCMTTLL